MRLLLDRGRRIVDNATAEIRETMRGTQEMNENRDFLQPCGCTGNE